MASDNGGAIALLALLGLIPVFGAACWMLRRANPSLRLEDLRVPLLMCVPFAIHCPLAVTPPSLTSHGGSICTTAA